MVAIHDSVAQVSPPNVGEGEGVVRVGTRGMDIFERQLSIRTWALAQQKLRPNL